MRTFVARGALLLVLSLLAVGLAGYFYGIGGLVCVVVGEALMFLAEWASKGDRCLR